MPAFIPRPYQHLIRNFIFDNDRGNVFASPGTGKTSSSIEAFAELKLFGEVSRALVLAPKRVAETTWPDDRLKFKESFGHLTMATCTGDRESRIKALRANADITTANYEQIPWLVEQYGDAWPFDMVIADESTRLKGLRVSIQRSKTGRAFLAGQGSSRAKALAQIAFKHVRRHVNLTGSPAPNGLVDCWGQAWFCDAGKRLGTSFTAFTQRYFRQAWGSEKEQQRFEIMPFMDDAIHRLLSEISITIDAKDWFDIAKPIEHHILIDLPPTARKQYAEMQKELFTWIEEHPLEAFSAGTKANKCLQIASGSVYYDREENWSPVHDAKLDALRSIVEETNGEPLLIAYQYRPDRERILKAFPQFKSIDQRGAQKDFEEGRLAGLVVHPASAGHGLNFQHHCRTLVDYSTGFNLEHDEQTLERVGPTRQAQIGSTKAVFRYRIVARDTIEQTVAIPRLQSKASVQDALKTAIKNSR